MATDFHIFFPTLVWSCVSTLDNNALLKECYEHKKNNSNSQYSNKGGYQGHEFNSEVFSEFIKNNIPKSKVHDGNFKNLEVYSWVNINGKGSWNALHSHFIHSKPILFSGVYYVNVPENSGEIGFHDPRGMMVSRTLDEEYLNGLSAPVEYVMPQAGHCYYFPSWLVHEVRENKSEEERVSIAFNVCVQL
tara:strand:- start:53 stop:622 length:570 start_codon:yes stop_codon:yes gene_type:complete